MIRVAVVDDHPHVAIAMRALLHTTPDIRLVAESKQGTAVLALVQQTRPDLLFLDLMMEADYDALTTVRELRRQFPQLKLCVLSAFMEPVYVRDLVQAGIQGYILKDDDYVTQLEAIIRDLMAGRLYLSHQAYAGLAQATQQAGEVQLLNARERDILQLAARGLPNPEIAQALHLAPGTVRNHLSAIYEKFHVRNRQEAILLAKERRLI
jgi:DNA-binding NarL/FixJ family response regulator